MYVRVYVCVWVHVKARGQPQVSSVSIYLVFEMVWNWNLRSPPSHSVSRNIITPGMSFDSALGVILRFSANMAALSQWSQFPSLSFLLCVGFLFPVTVID